MTFECFKYLFCLVFTQGEGFLFLILFDTHIGDVKKDAE